MMYGRNATELSICSRFSLFLLENQTKIQKIQAHADQNQETNFTVLADTMPARAANAPAQIPCASPCPRKDTRLCLKGRAGQPPLNAKEQRARISIGCYGSSFVKLHLALLSGLKPEAMVLPDVCAWLLAGPQAWLLVTWKSGDRDGVGEGGEEGRTWPRQFLALHRF